MILASLRTNQLSPAAAEWYLRCLSAFETQDVDAYFMFLADDCIVQTNSRVPYYGHDGLRKSLRRYFMAFEAVEHEPLNIYGRDDQFGTEMLTHFTPVGGKPTIVIPSTSFYDRGPDGLLRSIRKASANDELITISAADPLNLVGILSPGARVAAITAHRILLRDGVPVAALRGDQISRLEHDGALAERIIEHKLRIGTMAVSLRPYYA